MAPKKPPVTSSRRRAERASGSTKVAASTPQKRPTTTMQRPFQPGTRTRFENPSRGGSTTKSQTVGGGGKNLFGGAGDKNTAAKQGGPSAPKPAFSTSRAPFSRTGPTRASIGNVKPGAAAAAAPRQQARAQGQAAVKAAQQRRANLAKVQQDLRGQVGRAASLFSGPAGLARQAIVESVAPRPTSTRANLKEGMAAAKATMKAKAKSADSFGGQYQKPNSATKRGMVSPRLSKAKSFDNAFASARNSGMKTFVWEGKRYNTKMRGEK